MIGQVDTFLRDNLDWMGRASNWAKFTATASIGVVHRGHMKESMSLLLPYLPQGGVSALPYSEGGALYALGLIHSNKGSDGNAEVCLQTNSGIDIGQLLPGSRSTRFYCLCSPLFGTRAKLWLGDEMFIRQSDSDYY